MKLSRRRLALASCAAALCFAGSSSVWESNTYNDFLKGRFHGVSLTRDGRLTLAPRLETAAETGEAGVWSLATAPDGAVYFSTGHRGRVYRWKPGEKPALLWSAPQPEVFALALGAKGVLLAGSSPDGKVWKIENGKAAEFFDPGEKYIWALVAAPDGSVFVGTGQNGRVWRVSPSGQGEIWYETGQTHVTALALDSKGRLLAGTEPNGILYRIEGKNRAFVLYDSSLPEIRSIVPAADGSVYVAAMGGAYARRQAQAAGTAASQQGAGIVTTTVTVSADSEAAQRGIDLQPKPEQPKPPAPAPETPPPAPSIDLSAEKSALYRIHADNLVENLWSSKEENVYDLIVRGADLYFSTDSNGRIYRLSPDLKAALLVETREGETTRLAEAAGSLYAATSNQGKLYRLNGAAPQTGIYESPVHDAGNAARWGRLEWRAEMNSGKLSFRTRSGNSSRPDSTWSDWSEPITDPERNAVSSPNARYIQWRVEITPGAGPAPVLDSVAVSYQPQNGRPIVRSIQVTPQWAAAQQAKPAASPQQSSVAYSITVTDTGDTGQATSRGTPTQTISRTGMQQLYLSWQADDPDGDTLIYSLYYRGEDEREWKLLKADIRENTFQQDGEVFADGRYFFRVVASDRLANSPQAARESDLVSPPVLIDQTPPRVRILEPVRQGQEWVVEIRVEDSASPIRRAEYSVNAGPWTVLEAADGITDSREESFSVRLPAEGGERSLVVRAFDVAGNPGLARIVLR
ncbi:MAG: SMP-30/gluconolactonase/LRE family protein [Acidobacteriota bacterium]